MPDFSSPTVLVVSADQTRTLSVNPRLLYNLKPLLTGLVLAVTILGTVLTALIGIYYFKEPATAIKMVSMGLIVIGVMGLHSASRVGH